MTINAPAAGFVTVTGVATTYWRNAGACAPNCRVAARLRDTGAGGTATPHTLGTVVNDASGSAGLTPVWVFQVAAAGNRTYVLEVASAEGNAAGRTGVFNTTITASFSPFGLTGTPMGGPGETKAAEAASSSSSP